MLNHFPKYVLHVLRLSAWQATPLKSGSQQQGFTLIECLVAIVMVALVSGLIAPVLIVSVATRINSQRSEQALALAQQEIDTVRQLLEWGEYEVDDLPPVANRFVPADEPGEFDQVPAGSNDIQSAFAQDLFDVDIDNDGAIDFLVERFRTVGEDVDGIPVAFAMGVRVYDQRRVRLNEGRQLTPASLVMTSGDGGSGTRPLAALYTTLSVTDQDNALCNLVSYLNANSRRGGEAEMQLPAVCPQSPLEPEEAEPVVVPPI